MQHKLKIFTWHVHGSYLYYLTQANCEFYLPLEKGREGYGGRAGSFAWGDNVHEIPREKVKDLTFDIILFQSKQNYLVDQYDTLSDDQRLLPKIYLEHDPPREHPTDTKHLVNDPSMTLVHVTHFNNLMWDSGRTPTIVIDHGVIIPPEVHYTGKVPKGIVVINNIEKRGRRLGFDVYEKVKKEIPIDLIGMGSKEVGGLGEVPHEKIPEFISQYRFFFNPIRYTSLGLAFCEALMVGMPVVGLATTEMVTAVKNGVNGFVDTDINRVIEFMKLLIDNPEEAMRLSKGARQLAKERFNIDRFKKDWEKLFHSVISSEHVKEAASFQNFLNMGHLL